MALGSRPAPNVIQPARPHQAASSRATLAGGAARAAKLGIFTVAPPASTDICDQARGRPSLRRNSRPSRGSAALAFPTSGVSTERVRGQHAWSQMHGRLRRRCRAEEDRSPAFVPRKDTIAHATAPHCVRRATVAVARRETTGQPDSEKEDIQSWNSKTPEQNIAVLHWRTSTR